MSGSVHAGPPVAPLDVAARVHTAEVRVGDALAWLSEKEWQDGARLVRLAAVALETGHEYALTARAARPIQPALGRGAFRWGVTACSQTVPSGIVVARFVSDAPGRSAVGRTVRCVHSRPTARRRIPHPEAGDGGHGSRGHPRHP
ncbi:hypothetical protein GCM10010524_46010 [Streptomyces mexicanus]